MHTTEDNGSLLYFNNYFNNKRNMAMKFTCIDNLPSFEFKKIDLIQRLILVLPHFMTDERTLA